MKVKFLKLNVKNRSVCMVYRKLNHFGVVMDLSISNDTDSRAESFPFHAVLLTRLA